MKKKGTKDLTLTQRRQIEQLLQAKIPKRQIAQTIGIGLSTVYKEIQRGLCERKVHVSTNYWGDKKYKIVLVYCADVAEERYRLNQSTHGAPLKIGNDFEFVRKIEELVVNRKLSACAALGVLKREKSTHTIVSKTTLYRYIRLGYIFSKLCMQSVKTKKAKREKVKVKRPPKGTSIEQRLSEVQQRKIFGHWEMDCVLGKKHTKDTLLTFTERTTRYEIILRMPNHKASTVVETLNSLERKFGDSFKKIFKSITVDNGVEFSNVEGLETSVYGGKRTTLYYCHPYSSYERGSNERMNREIRRLIPKSTDITTLTDDFIKEVENWVNSYPREIFDYATSEYMFNSCIQQLNMD